MKIAILFAGQGAQHVGMGKELYDQFELGKKYFDRAEEVLNIPLKKYCFEGPENELKKTEITQPAILTVSYICAQLLRDNGITADVYAGFSLGEYSAITTAGYLTFEDGVKLVQERGLIMDRAVTDIDGGMAAILGLADEKVEEICREIGGIVVPVNYNCPNQLVISGESKAVAEACEKAEAAGALRTAVLKVSGPFHSPLLKKGGDHLRKYLEGIIFTDVKTIKIVSNVTADYHDLANMKELLVRQMSSPVKWSKSIEKLIAAGYDTFVEVGPGKTLRGFMRSIDRSQKALNVCDVKSLNNTLEELKK